jgi:ribosomal protein L37E
VVAFERLEGDRSSSLDAHHRARIFIVSGEGAVKKAKLRFRPIGKVDYEALGRPAEIFKWWRLSGKAGRYRDSSGKTVTMVGYSAFANDGPWFGVTAENLKHITCHDCGKAGAFTLASAKCSECGGHPVCVGNRHSQVFSADEWEKAS